MRRILTIAVAGLAGAAIGGVGLRVIAADAQQAPAVGFHAAAVSSTQSGDTTYAWFVGQDGSAQFCKIAVQGPHCAAVVFDGKH
jgi:hypothetical protein